MSEHQSEPVSGETGSVGTGPAGSGMSAGSEPSTAAAASVESPLLAPEQEETAPKPDAPKVEAAKVEAPKIELPKADAAKPEAPRMPGKLLIMSPADRAWSDDSASAKAEAGKAPETSGKRRMSAMAAVVALATVAGALGGALATAGLGHFAGGDAVAAKDNAKDSALEASVARIDADIVTLKASIEHTAKTGVSQFNKTNDRLDKVEKAQAEPAAKLAKLSEAVEKLRATPPAAAAAPVAAVTPAAARDVTGSVTPPASAAAASTKPEVGRLPIVEGWVLRDVADGGALVEGRRGVFEVYAGDPLPGVGRVDAIRKQDGRWVVVTSKGLIVAR